MTIRSYDSFEEMQADMARAETAAMDRVRPAQSRIGFGDHFMRPMGPDYDHLMIFGRVIPLDDIVASELLGVTEFAGLHHRAQAIADANSLLDSHEGLREDLTHAMQGDRNVDVVLNDVREACVDTGISVTDEELSQFGYVLRTTAEKWPRGYRFCKAFSLWEPDGEYGDTHVSTMIPLRPHEFEDARAVGWDFSRLVAHSTGDRKDWAIQMVMKGGPAAFDRDVR